MPSRPPRGFVKTLEAGPIVVGKPPVYNQPPKKCQKSDIRSWPSNQSASLPPLTVEDVEYFFEQERKHFSNSKSSTVGAYFRRIVSTSKTSPNFFQQLGKRVKESFGSFGRSSELLEPMPPTRPQDQDWVFFRGFGGMSPSDIVEPNPIYDVPRPQAPPRRKKSVDKKGRPVSRRTLSLTDVRSEELVLRSGAHIKVEPLYDFPRSTPIYAVVNKAAKLKNRSKVDSDIKAEETGGTFADKYNFEEKPANTISNDKEDVDNTFTEAQPNLSVGVNELPAQVVATSTSTIETCVTAVASLTSSEGVNVNESIKIQNQNQSLPTRLPVDESAPDEVDHYSDFSSSCHARARAAPIGAEVCTKDVSAAEQSQVAPMPSSSSLPIHVEECAGSISSTSSGQRSNCSGSEFTKLIEDISKHEGKIIEKLVESDKDEKSISELTTYHAEVYSVSKEANRMFEQQSEINQGEINTITLIDN
jgi:hypothetical protein